MIVEIGEILKRDDVITGRQLAEREVACPRMPPALDALWRFLSKHCRGRQKAKMASYIGQLLGGLDGKTITHMVSDLVVEHLKPVDSACSERPRGYYVIDTREEKEIAKARARHRRIASTRREIAIDRAPIEKRPPVQRELGFPS